MVGRRLDLSKSIPKDSPFLKTLAEQLTLMEFSIYAAIQRRYTYCSTHWGVLNLRCHTKKVYILYAPILELIFSQKWHPHWWQSQGKKRGREYHNYLPLNISCYWEAWSVDCLYMCVLCRELLNCNWKSRDKEKLAPNVCRLIRRTNEVRRQYLVTMVTW